MNPENRKKYHIETRGTRRRRIARERAELLKLRDEARIAAHALAVRRRANEPAAPSPVTPRELTPDDIARLSAAEAKRQRRQARNLREGR